MSLCLWLKIDWNYQLWFLASSASLPPPHPATPLATPRRPPTLALSFSVCNIKWVKRGNVSSLSTFAKKAYACYLIGFGLSYKITTNIAHNNNKAVVKLLPFMWPVATRRVCNEMIATAMPFPRIRIRISGSCAYRSRTVAQQIFWQWSLSQIRQKEPAHCN